MLAVNNISAKCKACFALLLNVSYLFSHCLQVSFVVWHKFYLITMGKRRTQSLIDSNSSDSDSDADNNLESVSNAK